MKVFSKVLITLLLTLPLRVNAQSSTLRTQSDSQREFIMSCTYGVLAGTLIGAASLAFVDRPSENLNKVARGASIGLYAGILLGAYVVYVLPGLEENEYEKNPLVSGLLNLNLLSDLNGDIDGVSTKINLYSF
jgi:hypothetical protein